MPSVPEVPPTRRSLFTLESISSPASPSLEKFPSSSIKPSCTGQVKQLFLKAHLDGKGGSELSCPLERKSISGSSSCCQHLYICSTFAEKHIHPGWEEKLKSWNKNSIFKGLISVLFLVISALH